MKLARLCALMALLGLTPALASQISSPTDSKAIETETMQHFQALVRFDTSDPPGNERPAAEYLQRVLEKEGIPVRLFSLEPNRLNVVARLKGNGKKRPLLIVGHLDVVSVDAAKWKSPPFGATRDGGYVYGRGTVDDKDNVVASLMTMLELKRRNIPLDRDVIFLAEAGEEGNSRLGMQFMANEHYAEIDAEYCLAEGGGVRRTSGEVRFATVQTTEKIPRAIQLTAHGISGHASVPLRTNAVVHLSKAISKIADWKTPIRFNDTTGTYFMRLAELSPPEQAQRYRDILSLDPRKREAADEYFLDHEPSMASLIRSSLSPTIVDGGYRVNVIPSDATATIDVRTLPDEDPARFLDEVRKVVDDSTIDVNYAQRDVRPGTPVGKLDSEAFKALEAALKKVYGVVTIPSMSTGATDMAYLRAKGMQCYGIGPAIDSEDAPKGFGAHSDQERILETELYRFVRLSLEVVVDLARAK